MSTIQEITERIQHRKHGIDGLHKAAREFLASVRESFRAWRTGGYGP